MWDLDATIYEEMDVEGMEDEKLDEVECNHVSDRE